MDIQNLLSELNAERNRIDQAILALKGLSSNSAPRRGRPPKSQQPLQPAASRKRTMSAAARAKISAAQKARWAKQRKNQAPVAAKSAAASKSAHPNQARSKRGITPAGRKRLSAMMKARWAELKKKAKAA